MLIDEDDKVVLEDNNSQHKKYHGEYMGVQLY